jgi:adenine/guanine phosphoribosyltransferase-like PRPP-binding protein
VEKLKAELDPADPWTVYLRETELERLQKTPRTTQLLFRMTAVDVLRLAKQHMTFRELARILDRQITVISRYAKGHVLPDLEHSLEMWRRLEPLYGLKSMLMELDGRNGFIDTSKLLGDPSALRLAATDCTVRFAGFRVTGILTSACNSVPLAAAIAVMLMLPVAVAKDHMDAGVDGFLETVHRVNGGRVEMLYLPEDSLKRWDSVLIVEDVVRTGRTVDTLAELVKQAKAEVAGVYTLIGFKQGLERLRRCGLRVEAVMEVEA